MYIAFSKIKHTPLKVKRNEDMPVLKMVITPDVEVCNKSDVEYVYEWRIVNAGFPLNYDIGNQHVLYILCNKY